MKNANKILSVLLVVSVLIVSLSFSGCTVSYDYKESGDVFGMLTCAVKLKGGDFQKAGGEIFKLMEEIDNAVSTSNENSSVYKFNHNGAKTASDRYEINSMAYEMAMKCKDIYDETKGIFNPAIYPLVEGWGVSSDTLHENKEDSGFSLPEADTVNRLLSYCKYEYLDIIKEEQGGGTKYYIAVKESALEENGDAKALKIDFGGYAKGYAADKAVEICRKYGVKYGIINISGNVNFLGKKPDGKDWYVELANPFWAKDGMEYEPFFCTFAAKECSPVSSGVYERYYSVKPDGKWAGDTLSAPIFNGDVYVTHIIDPSTGWPVNLERTGNKGNYTYGNTVSGIVNATVFSESSALADAYATVVTVLGMDKGIKFLESKGLKGIIITGNGEKGTSEYAVVGGVSIAKGQAGKNYELYKEFAPKQGYNFVK